MEELDGDVEPIYESVLEQNLANSVTTSILQQPFSDDERQKFIELNYASQQRELGYRYKQRRARFSFNVLLALYVLVTSHYLIMNDMFSMWLLVKRLLPVTIYSPCVVLLYDLVVMTLDRSGISHISDLISKMCQLYGVSDEEAEKALSSARGIPLLLWLDQYMLNIDPDILDNSQVIHHSGIPRQVQASLNDDSVTAEIYKNTYIRQQHELAKLLRVRRVLFTSRMMLLKFIATVVLYSIIYTKFYLSPNRIADIPQIGLTQALFTPYLLLLVMDGTCFILHTIHSKPWFTSWSRLYDWFDVDRFGEEDCGYLYQRDGIPFLVWVTDRQQRYADLE